MSTKRLILLRTTRQKRAFCGQWCALEPLENWTLLSGSQVPVEVVVFGGTALNYSSIILGEGGHTLDGDVVNMAHTAYQAAKAWSVKSRLELMQWGTIGDATKQGHTAAVRVEQDLAADPELHDLLVIGYSRGSYPANQMIQEVVRTSLNLRHTEFVMLDPTGIKALGDQPIQPLEWGGRVHTIYYHDGLHPFSKNLVVDEYPLPGTSHLIPPLGSGSATSSHGQFPNFYNGVNYDGPGTAASLLVNDFIQFVGADNVAAGKIRYDVAHNIFGGFPSPFRIAGGGPGIALPILQDAVVAGLTQLYDDSGNIVGLTTIKTTELAVTVALDATHYFTRLFGDHGSILKDFNNVATSIDDAISHVTHDIENWLKKLNPFSW